MARHLPWIASLAIGLAFAPATAAPRGLALRTVRLELPAPPAAIVPADLDGDGRMDLLVVTASSTWGSVSEDRVEAAVLIADVVPALFEKREARAFLQNSDGSYRLASVLEIGEDLHAVQAGPAKLPALAVTDEGVAVFRIQRGSAGEALVLEPWLAARTVLSESGTFLSRLDVVQDADGDGTDDLVLPREDGLAIYRGAGGAFESEAAFHQALPGDEVGGGARPVRSIPRPIFEDLDGDGRKELIVLGDVARVFRGLGSCRFAPPRTVRLDCLGLGAAARAQGEDASKRPQFRALSFLGDLDGDGRAEIVTRMQKNTGKGDFKQAQQPVFEYRVHRVRPDFTVESVPARTFDAKGYASAGDMFDPGAPDFRDLDGDKRKDLVVVTLDVSVFQALRVLTTKRLSVGLSFGVWAQRPDGSFAEVPGQSLDEKLTFDFNDLKIGRLAQFAGDFDGDGRIDFVHLGRGRTVSIHRGGAGGRYPEKADLELELDEPPQDVALVRVADFDGDGRADLAVTRTLGAGDDGASAPARLELRLSGAAK